MRLLSRTVPFEPRPPNALRDRDRKAQPLSRTHLRLWACANPSGPNLAHIMLDGVHGHPSHFFPRYIP